MPIKIFLLIILNFIYLNSYAAGRSIVVTQAYELNGAGDFIVSPATPIANGSVAVGIVLTNLSSINQTVILEGGLKSNRPRPSTTGVGKCDFVVPTTNYGSQLIENTSTTTKVSLNPEGSAWFWCTIDHPGGEGLLKLKISVLEDRGAVNASGTIIVRDDNNSNWGNTGAGPFVINGGRPF